MASLRTLALSKSFRGPVPALRDLSLSVDEGEWLVLFGPSGCGKTTTLRLIAGLDQPSAGSIFIGDTDVTRLPPWRRGVAMAFQRPVLLPHRNVRAQVTAALAHPTSSAGSPREPMTACLRTLGIAALLDRYAHQLSGGEKQRVALALALTSRARLLLLDEPLAHVDLPLRRKLWTDLVLLRSSLPATMLYVTHDPAEALALADRIAVLYEGGLVQLGRPLDLLERPEHRFLAEALASPDDPLNLLEGRIESSFFTGTWGKLKVTGSHLASGANLQSLPKDQNVALAVAASQLLARPVDDASKACIMNVQCRFGFHLLACRAGDNIVQVRADANAGFQPGQMVMIELAGNKVHWFDSVSGRRLKAGSG